jgi:hypothetical protein
MFASAFFFMILSLFRFVMAFGLKKRKPKSTRVLIASRMKMARKLYAITISGQSLTVKNWGAN